LALALTFGLIPGAPSPGAKAYPSDSVGIEGHGWGHGRGMGQYGALGYALAGWDWPTILGHYYSNTVDGGIGNPGLFVRLLRLDDHDTIVFDPTGTARVNGAGARRAYMVRLVGANSFAIWASDDCAGGPTGWQQIATNTAGPITISSLASDGVSSVLQTCEVGGNKRYRNDIVVADSGAGQRTLNGVLMDNYLRGVVPAESPASWASLGGGSGMNALRAQAVAARSYAWSENRYAYAKTCDTDACQVYRGVDAEAATSNQAVADTSGHIRLKNGNPARTEFSSSTGGQTAGGEFPSVADDGDAVCVSGACNPNHNWSASIPVSTIQAKYPSIGTLQAVSVTERTPADGGLRVQTIALRGSSGTATIGGDTFRSVFGLKSTWFNVVGSPSGGVNGYWLLGSDAGLFSFGRAGFYGSMGGKRLNQPVVGMASTASGGGYWLVARDGGIFAFGDAVNRFYGSMGGRPLNKPVVGMARTASGNGYWLVASDGGIFAFGDAVNHFYGSTGGMRLNQPVVGMAPTSTGNGYWLVASDGGIFAFGDAVNHFYGSTGGLKLARPVIGMSPIPNDRGYWLVAADGGVFAFGDAPFFGSLPSRRVVGTAAGLRSTATGGGYVIAEANGNVNSFGDAPFFGTVSDVVPGFRGTIIGIDVSLGG
jgi:SpoIID/LytB domain protein